MTTERRREGTAYVHDGREVAFLPSASMSLQLRDGFAALPQAEKDEIWTDAGRKAKGTK